MSRWPRNSFTATKSTPAMTRRLAAVCRRVCQLAPVIPARRKAGSKARRRKARLSIGWLGSFLRRAGIDHLTIMRITGHKTMEVFKRYNSFLEGDLRDAAHRFNTYLTLAHQSGDHASQKYAINHAARP